MKIEDIKNVAVFFNMNGKTVALRMDAEQKRIVALMALNPTFSLVRLTMSVTASPERRQMPRN
ncbi:TPA: hypothetical protein ACPT0V_000626 [Escherichia coli]